MRSDVLDLIRPGSQPELLANGAAWSEGPLWLPRERRVRWSDIPNNRILEWDAATGERSVFRFDAEYANGRALDRDGLVVQCSHGRRAIERESAAGPQVIASRWEGGRFNSPNDLTVAGDGSIWFTDPPYGLHPSGREGYPGTSDYGGCFVFRLEPQTGEAIPVITDMVHPNGIAFSPDESVLYVTDTGAYADGENAHGIRCFRIDGRGLPADGSVFATVPTGLADGIAVDVDGRLWSSGGDGIYVYETDGSLRGHLPIPETVANLTFGGDDGHDLFIAASTSLYRVSTTTCAA